MPSAVRRAGRGAGEGGLLLGGMWPASGPPPCGMPRGARRARAAPVRAQSALRAAGRRPRCSPPSRPPGSSKMGEAGGDGLGADGDEAQRQAAAVARGLTG